MMREDRRGHSCSAVIPGILLVSTLLIGTGCARKSEPPAGAVGTDAAEYPSESSEQEAMEEATATEERETFADGEAAEATPMDEGGYGGSSDDGENGESSDDPREDLGP